MPGCLACTIRSPARLRVRRLVSFACCLAVMFSFFSWRLTQRGYFSPLLLLALLLLLRELEGEELPFLLFMESFFLFFFSFS